MSNKIAYTLDEAADLTSLSRSTLRCAAQEGIIGFKYGNGQRWYFTHDELIELIESSRLEWRERS